MPTFGAGPLIAGPALVWLVVSWAVGDRLFDAFKGFPASLARPVGVAMVCLGVAVYAGGIRQFRHALGGKLVTDGLFAWCRHPFYALWLFFLLPGLACIVGNWLALVAPAMAAGTFAAVIGREERELEERFGQDYRDYSRRVGRLWPRRNRSQ